MNKNTQGVFLLVLAMMPRPHLKASLKAVLYVSYILLGYLFGLDDSKAGAEVRNRMQPVLLEVLPTPMQNRLFEFGPVLTSNPDKSGTGKPKLKAKRLQTLEELLKAHPEIKEVLIDATEQEVPRPVGKRPTTAVNSNAIPSKPRSPLAQT
ncbi:MAG: hypothetical protein IVW51_10835 [Thermaceae bacterium]|nr:hypothetical protein [Thermaceae bacterium]